MARLGGACFSHTIRTMVANLRHMVTGFGAGTVIAVLTAATAATEPAKPLAPEDCQREWWISIDCFGVPETPKPPASMAKAAPDAAGAMGEIGEPKKIGEPEKDAPMMEPAPKY